MQTRKLIIRTAKLLIAAYFFVCVLLFFFQEKLIFSPEKLDKDFRFSFAQPFEEIGIQTKDKKLLSGVLFTAASSKGLVFYLHGNAGSIRSWGEVANRYTNLNYDVFILDFRGYGKSEGAIQGEKQIFNDVQSAYDVMKKRYSESKIVVLGYSIGTGPAVKIASTNHPRILILQAPYYSLVDIMRHTYPIIPTFLLKYRFETNEYIGGCKMPVVIFHGDHDEAIYYNSSNKLKKLFKNADTLITLKGQSHNGITDNPQYVDALTEILK